MNNNEFEKSIQEKKLDSRKVYSGKLLQVYSDRVSLPDGKQSFREWIDHPGASAVLPVFENGQVQLIRQFRYPLGHSFLEVPAGKIDPGESPISTAKRELLEECGIIANRWVSLGAFHPCIGYTNEIIYCYLAWDLQMVARQTDEDEFLISIRMAFIDAVRQALGGDITDGKTITALLRAASWWRVNAPFPAGDLPG